MSLKDYYYDISKPGALSGHYQFIKSLKALGIDHDPDQVKVQQQEPISFHRPFKKKFRRNNVIVAGIDNKWQIDLVDMKKFGEKNKANHYILTVIDVFSKYACVMPVYRKSGNYTTRRH